ncbi:MAG TPA: cytochrome b [Steroidobacteraceae bacterium]|nr:cytochrome b [Steroidobacteraceae bacterium]
MVARPTAAAPALDPGARYTKLAVTLHWLIAALVVAQLGLGWWMLDIPKQPGGVRAFWFNVHKSIGMTIALLVLVRIAWRLRHPAPLLPARVPAWQRRAAAVNHALLYVCLLGMPLVGFLGSTFSGYPIRYFGVALPAWGYESAPLKDFFSAVHLGFAWVFMTLIALHAGAALKHLLVDRDAVFWRMWPFSRDRQRALEPNERASNS